MRKLVIGWLTLGLAAMTYGQGVELVVQLPAQAQAKSACATARELKLQTAGTIHGSAVSFANLLAETPYDLSIVLSNGITLCGVDMSWYNEEPAREDAGAITEEDRKQIQAILEIPSFYNQSKILLISGSHDRAVVLVQLVRDKAFHASEGDAIWRVELWYFKNQYGGWEKIAQQNKVLRRERFKKFEDFAATGKIRWLAELGAIRVGKEAARQTLTLPEAVWEDETKPTPSTRP